MLADHRDVCLYAPWWKASSSNHDAAERSIRSRAADEGGDAMSDVKRLDDRYAALVQAAAAVIGDARDQGRDDCMDDLVDEQFIERLRKALNAISDADVS